ncbi:MAG: NfeD family protein [Pirellulaceae bacterium]
MTYLRTIAIPEASTRARPAQHDAALEVRQSGVGPVVPRESLTYTMQGSYDQFMKRGMLLFGIVILCECLVAAAQDPVPAPRQYTQGVVISVEGVLLPRLERFVNRKLDESQQLGADLVILEIDSPGGALDSTLKVAARLNELPWAHTVAYIPDEALSGAAILALACDEIVMCPRARLGDAGPIFQGPDALFRHAPEKIRSDLALRVRDLAADKGRPPALAEAMVDMNLPVFRVVHRETGAVTYLSQHEIDALEKPELWEKGPMVLESKPGSFLEVNGQRAVELQLAATTVANRTELEQRYPVTRPFILLKRGAVDTAVDVLNLPLVTALLFVIGATALYVELSAPGIGLGGLIAGLSFTLFFWSRFLGGTAGWLEVILVLAGVIFLAVEIFILPGFGIAGIAGILLMGTGIVLASQNHVIPQSARGMQDLGTSLVVLVCSGFLSLIAAAVFSRYFGSIPVLNRLILRAPLAAPQDAAKGPEKPLPPLRQYRASVGDWGVAESPLRPAGKAIFGEEYLDVIADGSYVDRGRQVRIIQMSGNRIVVREVDT